MSFKLTSELGNKSHEILVVDDEQDICELITGVLQDEGFQTRYATTGQEALDSIAEHPPSLIIQDIWLNDPDYDGMKILKRVVQLYPDLPVLMMSGHGTIETAVNAIKIGAYDFIEKPFKSDRLLLMVYRALEAYEMAKENQELKEMLGEGDELVGQSPVIKQLRADIERIGPTKSRVLIHGPSGVGKELVARQIHEHSPRKNAPFLIVNCGTLTRESFEEELFGTLEKEDLDSRKIGIFEKGNRGTVLLDEVGHLSSELQARLVRVLHEMAIEPKGGGRKIKIDVRFLVTTSQNLEQLVAEKKFRQDLYYRLNVVTLKVPSLLERREDIICLAQYFAEKIGDQLGKVPCEFDEKSLLSLKGYEWPGNARQLKNVVEHVMILNAQATKKITITPDLLPGNITGGEFPSDSKKAVAPSSNVLQLPLREARESFEREYLVAQVNRFSGNISQTASFVGMERSALHRKLRNLDVRRGSK